MIDVSLALGVDTSATYSITNENYNGGTPVNSTSGSPPSGGGNGTTNGNGTTSGNSNGSSNCQ